MDTVGMEQREDFLACPPIDKSNRIVSLGHRQEISARGDGHCRNPIGRMDDLGRLGLQIPDSNGSISRA